MSTASDFTNDLELEKKFIAWCNLTEEIKKKEMNSAELRKMLDSLKLYNTKFTSTDTDIAFKVVSKNGRTINYQSFASLLIQLSKKISPEIIANKMKESPRIFAKKITSKTGNVDKMTDSSQYTGSHRERFDSETGKGKGIDGRKDLKDNSGYVTGFKKN
ncbi:tubulin polymerization-promoting protein family member 2-like [Octopus sinensis]|uniref:Tubulin polymerization-promoting protein family member 2-like n=1 Tax=Octopus sinensis TaxID=2607531 RepID=A0A6P7TVF5_9MOLL|nr:tubulin polymerization-promoting protein family member 2-like [Octopus sinensis]